MSLHDAQLPPPDSLIGKQFDEYLIESPLGSGGMAQVYLAIDRKLQRRVALKVIASKYRIEGDYITRFEREAQSVARLEHANIVRLYRYGQVGDVSYMAMQFIEGADLEYLIRSYRQTSEFMSPADVLNVIRDIALALDYAHEQGVIHRDVKPGNIILDKTGRAFLSDFGLALLNDIGTRGEILGSPLYIAPEQAISSANVVPQSDLYSLGVVLFEMLTGELPFVASDPMDIAMQHVSDPPPRPEQYNPAIPAAVSKVVLCCLEKEPAARYQTGAALVKALERAITAWATGTASVSASHLHASRLTNLEKVNLRLDTPDAAPDISETPTLPPLPPPPPNAGSARTTATLTTASRASESSLPANTITQTRTSPAPRLPVSVLIGVGAAIAIVALILVSGVTRRPSSTESPIAANSTIAPLPVLIPTLTIIPITQTEPPTPTALVLPTLNPFIVPPTITAIMIQPVAPPTEYLSQSALPSPVQPTIVLATPMAGTFVALRDDNWIALLNASSVPLTLERFEVRQKDRVLKASDWGIAVLFPGDCLRMYKGGNAPKQNPKRCEKNIYDYDADKKTRDSWFKGNIQIIVNETTSYEIKQGDD